MVVLRLTRRLLSRVGQPEQVDKSSTTILGDWSGHLVFVGRARFVLLVSELSRLPVVMPGRDLKNLARDFPVALAPVLLSLGVPPAAVDREVGAMSEVTIAVTNNHSVLGCINEFSRALDYRLWDEPDADLVEVALWLGETPLTPLGHQSPDRVTRRLFSLGREAMANG